MILSEVQLEYVVVQIIETYNNIEIYDISKFETDKTSGLKFDLFDFLDKGLDFEEDIECILDELDRVLDANILISHEYGEETSVCGLDGEFYPDYHCYLYVGFMN